MLSINTNTSSLIAQNSMESSTNKLNQAIERMTTGAKINHAKDNAANYSIATNMTTKINAYQVAEDNCAMGLDLISSASSTLDLISGHLTRIRDLAVQASNGTYGNNSLNAVQAEVNARLDEIERIYTSAEYNGINYLAGEKSIKEESTNVPFLKQITKLSNEEAIAQGYTLVGSVAELKQALNNNESVCLTSDMSVDLNSDYFVKDYKNAVIEGNGYTLNISDNSDAATNQALFGTVTNVLIQNLNLNYNGEFSYKMAGISYTANEKLSVNNCAFTGSISTKYTYSAIAGTNNGHIELKDTYVDVTIENAGEQYGIFEPEPRYNNGTADTTNYYYNKDAITDNTTSGATSASELNALLANAYNTRNIETKADKTLSLQIGINGDDTSEIRFSATFNLDLATINCLSADAAKEALKMIDSILIRINDRQVGLGAAQNRLESALDEISTQYDNLVSSRSTIQDADIAEVSSEYIKMQILQQAGATLMATANQSPAIALQLL